MKYFIDFGPLMIVMIVTIIMTYLYVKHKRRANKFLKMLDDLMYRDSHLTIILNDTRTFSNYIIDELINNWKCLNSKHSEKFSLLGIEQIYSLSKGDNYDINCNKDKLNASRTLMVQFNEVYRERIKKYIEENEKDNKV
jgi:hypothetical protein